MLSKCQEMRDAKSQAIRARRAKATRRCRGRVSSKLVVLCKLQFSACDALDLFTSFLHPRSVSSRACVHCHNMSSDHKINRPVKLINKTYNTGNDVYNQTITPLDDSRGGERFVATSPRSNFIQCSSRRSVLLQSNPSSSGRH